MLKSLAIKNYALIKDLEIEFDNGFSTITGETGAGKSILLGALSLILGERADTSALLDKKLKCIVEGRFNITELNLNALFEENDLDFDEETIIRREINSYGKSRAFINDTPVNLNTLKEIGDKLVDIHSQNSNKILNDLQFQLSVIDILADNIELVDKYSVLYKNHKELVNTVAELETKASESKKELDYLQFQYEQLDSAKLNENEQEDLENEYEIFTHAEEIKSSLASSFYILSEDEKNINLQLHEVRGLISKITKYYSKAEDHSKRIESVIIEIKDITSEIEAGSENIEFDPDKIKQIRERLDLIYNLQQKHQVKTIHELLVLKNDLESKLNVIDSYDDQIEKYKREEKKIKNQLLSLADKISDKRKSVIPHIQDNILKFLRKLGMPDALLEIHIVELDHLKPNGKDEVKFLFSASEKVEGREIAKVASGGEISRVMLAIKSLISRFKTLPTIIFDEIDSGVSGDIAHKMAEIMDNMSENMQVISITHVAQIASKGKVQYSVFKDSTEEVPATRMKLLNNQERIVEIAKMLSGKSLTNAAIENAKELLSLN